MAGGSKENPKFTHTKNQLTFYGFGNYPGIFPWLPGHRI